eukprot:NODE_3050_length_988_cov_8.318424_g2548_i0.p1 GENE.NODE_3050_length_988_cov_8.318424_g2548_i0~~NODE_3050_length_988_cov_8.318424_g2548_i0.p1  ORF type:complete len:290 (+),score=43.27 NODE_3050_length_988_cov_8.318424_g2548_i0:47-916(+)
MAKARDEDAYYTSAGQRVSQPTGAASVSKKVCREEGTPVPQGGDLRTCLADTVWAVLDKFKVDISQDKLRKILAPTEARDPTIHDATVYLQKTWKVRVIYTSKCTQQPHCLLQQSEGVYMVRLRWNQPATEDEEEDEDYHCLMYDAQTKTIVDNKKYQQTLIKIEPSDWKSKKAAEKAIALGVRCRGTVEVLQVYRCFPPGVSPNLPGGMACMYPRWLLESQNATGPPELVTETVNPPKKKPRHVAGTASPPQKKPRQCPCGVAAVPAFLPMPSVTPVSSPAKSASSSH